MPGKRDGGSLHALVVKHAALSLLGLALAAGAAGCGGGPSAQADRCQGIVCTASDACHVAGCDPATGACTDQPRACAASDACHVAGCDLSTGACTNEPRACAASDACHVAGCDLSTGACTDLLRTSLVEVATTGGPVFTNGGSCLAATATSGAAGSLTFAAEPGAYTCTLTTAGSPPAQPTPALGAPFACAPGQAIRFSGLSDLGDEGHPYTLTVAGPQPSAALVWEVDTTPPGVSFQVSAPRNAGTASVTLTASEATTAVTCALDGGAVACGPIAPSGGAFVGTAAAAELSAGAHDFAAWLTDAFGNASAAPATTSFAVTFGPNQGRAVLIGHARDEVWYPPDSAHLILRRALAEVPWRSPGPGYGRRIRLATFEGSSDGPRTAEVLAAIGDLYDVPSAAVITTTDPAELSAKLKTRDVLLVPVQLDAALSAEAGRLWHDTLLTFLGQGGVVVVLDGAVPWEDWTADTGLPYLTHRVLSTAPTRLVAPLLQVTTASNVGYLGAVAKPLTPTELVYPADASPLTDDPGAAFEYLSANGTVTFSVSDAAPPRSVYESGGAPVVLEKIFPAYAVQATLTASGAALTGSVPPGAQITLTPAASRAVGSYHCAWRTTNPRCIVNCRGACATDASGRFLTPSTAGTYTIDLRLVDPRERPGNAYQATITVTP